MIFGFSKEEIMSKAVECQSSMTDGVVQYNYEDGKLFGAGFTTGTLENPANPFIEVYRLPQGERGEFDCKCHENGDCPFWIESEDDFCGGHFDEEMTDEYGDNRVTCCINSSLEDWDLEEEIKESIEEQVRDVISEYLGDTISKLNEIRIAISDIIASYDYFNVRQDDWEMRVLDSYVDDAVENGFVIDCEPADYLDAEVSYIAEVTRYNIKGDVDWDKVSQSIEEHDFERALELL